MTRQAESKRKKKWKIKKDRPSRKIYCHGCERETTDVDASSPWQP